jgi:hypothetical protein
MTAYLSQNFEEGSGECREGRYCDTVMMHHGDKVASRLHIIFDLVFEFPNGGGHGIVLHILEAEHDSPTEDEVLPACSNDVPHLLSSVVYSIQRFLKLPAQQGRVS